MSRHLRSIIAIRVLIITTVALIAAVRIARAARHPLRHARYLAARAVRRIPGRPADGGPLTDDEMRAYIVICHGWKHPAADERSRT